MRYKFFTFISPQLHDTQDDPEVLCQQLIVVKRDMLREMKKLNEQKKIPRITSQDKNTKVFLLKSQ